MPRDKLKKIIVPKSMPSDVTLSLTRSFDNPLDTVQTYWFTDTIREYFERVLEDAARGRGQGFWIEAEYGAGKTHFLATLGCLLANTGDEALWAAVRDEAVRNYRARLSAQRLFPVVLTLKGHSSVDAAADRMLLRVLERAGVEPALDRAGLAGLIQVTTTDELLAWHESLEPELRGAIERYVKAQTGFSSAEYCAGAGRPALAEQIRSYCDSARIQPRTSATVRDRLLSIYNQLTSPALQQKGAQPYTGLLVIIDEWEFWQRLHASGTPEAAHDEEVLETLGYVLPRDLGVPVITLVGSQTAVPAKLRGGQAGDRFISLPLLRGSAEREYDVIVSHRVRDLDPDCDPELDLYYDYCRANFAFAKGLDKETFANTFPFQPRCFDVVRHVTARDLPTARSGIYILHQALYAPGALDRDSLLTVSDLLASQHLNEAFTNTVYREAAGAYRAALDALPSLNMDADDSRLADKLLKTLFLWHIAYLEVPKPMSLTDLVEATLTQSDILSNEDTIELVLNQMSALPQVEFKDRQARFVVTGIDVEPFFVKLDRYRRQIIDRHTMQQTWQESLFYPATRTGGQASLFGQYELDKVQSVKVVNRHLEYGGEVVIASRWRAEYGDELRSDDKHFRVVILTQVVQPDQLGSADLHDERIAVVVPGALTASEFETAREYLAALAMDEAYNKQIGQEAEGVRQELTSRVKPETVRALLATQQRVFRNGRIITQKGLGLDAAAAFAQPSNDQRLDFIVDKLLTGAYRNLPLGSGELRKDFTASDAAKLFDGFFSSNVGKAEESAMANFSVGLGLARADNPRQFAPDGAPALKVIKTMLEEAGDGELQVWKVYDRLSRPTYGLPYALISLYLLSFVRYSQDPVVNLHLKVDHNIRLRSGDQPPHNVLGRGNVVQLAWKSGMERWFNVLAPTEDVWPQVVPFGRVLQDDLTIGTDAGEVETQQARLAERLGELKDEVSQAERQLEQLKTAFGRPLPPDDRSALARMRALFEADTYTSFAERLGEAYTQPEPLKEDLQTLTRLREVALSTAEIQAAKAYLDQVEADALPAELQGDLLSLKGQIDLESIVAQPNLWSSIQSNFERFRRSYAAVYRIHHRDTHKALQRLGERLSGVPRRLEVLALLNSVDDLGRPVGTDLEGRYNRLQPRLKPCQVKVNEVRVESIPVCEVCRLRLSGEAPEDEAEQLLRGLQDALDEQLRRLKTEAIHQVLAEAETGSDRMPQLIKAIELSSLDSLIDVMDAGLVAFIARALELQGVGTVPATVLQRLSDRYPILEEKDVPSFVTAVKALLDEEFAKARKQNPDKQTIRLSLK